MKKIMLYLCVVFAAFAGSVRAQDSVRTVYIPAHSTLHFISPEPIRYVDISSKSFAGDLPLKNVLRIRQKDSVKVLSGTDVTVAGEKFIARFHVLPGVSGAAGTSVEIGPVDMRPLDISGIGFSINQLKAMALNIVAGKAKGKVEKVSAFDIKGQVNHIYTMGDYIFLDLSYRNKTRLRYDIDGFRFRIDDKKVTKASNVQSLEIRPEFTLFDQPSFARHYRNVFVFKKMSFPGNKVLNAELSEKQISGRVITLTISYQDILDADTIPN